jgi:hypothetical protein
VKVGDLIMDHDLGQTGIVVEFAHRRNVVRVRCTVVHNYYRVLYEDGNLELVCAAIDDVEVIS